ncbi:hypothetical protein A3D88_04050 [Candidatus Peribacteria bacterium RIFCSPHIGHO2_02_FULL_52_16]|nr:MAG: hypothetical protein A3D88_04050 [Candidatus Peribacteria bacterium RIFCSPHIGHO2_02_FULL_52_16]
MKILMIAPTPFFSHRGTHIRILEEAIALERLGHSVTIATYHIGSDIPSSCNTHTDVRRIRRLLFWYKKLEAGPDWQKIILDLMLVRKVFFLARTLKPDIMHGHLHEGVLIGWFVQKILFWRRIPLVADFHGSLTKEMVSHDYLHSAFLHKIFRWIERRINALGDRAVASAWNNAADITAVRKKDTVAVALDGAKIFSPLDDAARTAARKKYGIPDNAILATYTGAFVANKGMSVLIDTIPLVIEKNAAVHFVLAGFPFDAIAHALDGRAWRTHVTIITPLDYFSLGTVLGMSDIGIDPKHEDTGQASGKMLQYMGAGLPVACFDTENNRRYVADGAIYARERSARGLAEAILSLADDAQIREKKGKRNKAGAEKYSWAQSGKELSEIYATMRGNRSTNDSQSS